MMTVGINKYTRWRRGNKIDLIVCECVEVSECRSTTVKKEMMMK